MTSSLSIDKFQDNIMINYIENPQFNETSICKITKDIITSSCSAEVTRQ